MPQVTANPLPIGRYWANVGPADIAAFDGWLTANAPALFVENTSQTSDGFTFLIFNVKAPVLWQGPGYPEVADASVKTYADAITSPALPDSEGSVITAVESIASKLAWGAFGLLALYVLVANRKS